MTALLLSSITLIAYTFIGYPAVMALLARLRPKPVASDPQFEPNVSLIIVAYNEADVIASKLANTAKLDYPPEKLEVIVVADGSTDLTVEKASSVSGTKVLHQPQRRGKLSAMNRAAQAAVGDILIFSDANNLYVPETVRELVKPFADHEVGMVTGRKVIDDGQGDPLDRAEGLYWRYESRIKAWESACGSVAAVAGEALAFRRDAFYPPPAGTLTEDFVQAMLAVSHGWRVVYAPRAVSVERASATLGDEAVRRSRLVTGRLQSLSHTLPGLARADPRFAWQVISHKWLRPIVPWALVSAAVSNVAVARRRRRWARVLLMFQGLFYGSAVAGWRNERRGRRNALLYLPYYICRMNLASLSGTEEFLRGRHGPAWAKVRRAS